MAERLRCIECGGSKFVRKTFFHVWRDEYVDTAMQWAEYKQIEEDFMDTIEYWHCYVCSHEVDHDTESDLVDQLEHLWYINA